MTKFEELMDIISRKKNNEKANNKSLVISSEQKEELEVDLARYMNVIPVSFSASAKDMLLHTKELLEHERPLVAINPRFQSLITALRTCQSDDLGKVNKEQTSYDDLLDAFRLALKGINLVK